MIEEVKRRVEPLTEEQLWGDQTRMRVPVWRCPVCKESFHTREAMETHRKEQSHE